MIRKLLEARTIEDEYNKDWSDIKKEDFDLIISLDPQTDISKNRIGSSAKQLLLPRYVNGETDFISKPEEVKNALTTYQANRGSYPQVLRNIAVFPSVKDFVDYITLGDDSEFAKNHDFTDLQKEPEEKQNNLDKIYNKFYNKIDREVFNQIINLDPQTTDTSIGEVAKNLLLPKYQAGEDFLSDGERIENAISLYYAERDTYPADRKELGKYKSVKEFTDFVSSGGESNYLRMMQSKVDEGKIKQSEYRVITSTREYDVLQPYSWHANAYIVGKESPKSSDYKLRWCTGYMNDDSYWRSYSNHGPIVCFIWKEDPWDRKKSFQLNLNSDGSVYEFLDGSDDRPWGKNATPAFEEFLSININVLLAIKDVDIFKNCKVVLKVLEKHKLATAPLEYNSREDLQKVIDAEADKFVKEVRIHTNDVPATSFSGFTSLKTVVFDASVKRIGVQAFFNCTSLNKVTLPPELEEIGSEAFAGCTSLSNTIKLPDTLVKIGRGAFRDTHCKLSINKARDKKLKIDPTDHDWFVSHAKAITIQNNEALEEELNEDILDENIPKDLARAYQNSIAAERGIVANPDSEHVNIGGKVYGRKSVKYDYYNSNYEAMTPDQVIEYLTLRVNVDPNDRDADGKIILDRKVNVAGDRNIVNQRISTLRFIFDNKVIEYEVRGGNVLYLAYYMTIPDRYFRDYPYFKGKNGPTRDVRFATKYSDLYAVIQMADKIYKTDEYEHLITDTTPSRGKVKVARLNDDGTPATDEAGNPIYDIVDDTIKGRRNRNKKWRYLRKYIPAGDTRHREHAAGYNFGADEDSNYSSGSNAFHDYAADVLDTGAHKIEDIYSMARGDGSSKIIVGQYSAYINCLKEKKTAFKRFDYIRKALKKLEAERDLYDEDEYNEAFEELNEKKDSAYKTYQTKVEAARKAKDKLVFIITEDVENANKAIKDLLVKIQDLINKEYQTYQKLMQLKSKSIREFSSRIQNLERQLKSINDETERLKRHKEEVLEQIARLQQDLSNTDVSIQQKTEQAVAIQVDISAAAEEEITRKFEQMDALEKEMTDLQREIDELAPKQAQMKAAKAAKAGKQNKKELDPNLVGIVDETPDAEEDVYQVRDGEAETLKEFTNKDEAIS